MKNIGILSISVALALAMSAAALLTTIESVDAARDQSNQIECRRQLVGVCAGLNADAQVCAGVLGDVRDSCNRD